MEAATGRNPRLRDGFTGLVLPPLTPAQRSKSCSAFAKPSSLGPSSLGHSSSCSTTRDAVTFNWGFDPSEVVSLTIRMSVLRWLQKNPHRR